MVEFIKIVTVVKIMIIERGKMVYCLNSLPLSIANSDYQVFSRKKHA